MTTPATTDDLTASADYRQREAAAKRWLKRFSDDLLCAALQRLKA